MITSHTIATTIHALVMTPIVILVLVEAITTARAVHVVSTPTIPALVEMINMLAKVAPVMIPTEDPANVEEMTRARTAPAKEPASVETNMLSRMATTTNMDIRKTMDIRTISATTMEAMGTTTTTATNPTTIMAMATHQTHHTISISESPDITEQPR